MKGTHITAAIVVATLLFAATAQAQLRTDPKTLADPPSWSQNAANYRISLTGSIGMADSNARRDLTLLPAEARLTAQIVMDNGLVVPLETSGGVLKNSNDPARRIFHRDLRGGSRHVTDLNVAFVELVYSKDWDMTRYYAMHRRAHSVPDEWTLEDVQIDGKIYQRNPLTGQETLVAERRLINVRPQVRMTYGLWSSSDASGVREPPAEVRTAPGSVMVQVLVGDDDMKAGAEAADILLQTTGGVRRRDLASQVRSHAMNPHVLLWYRYIGSFPGEPLAWNAIGKVGLFYRYGDHGLDRDDWDVDAILVDHCPVFLRSEHICFRKASHYIGRTSARLARLNGDGAGTEAWAPFVVGR